MFHCSRHKQRLDSNWTTLEGRKQVTRICLDILYTIVSKSHLTFYYVIQICFIWSYIHTLQLQNGEIELRTPLNTYYIFHYLNERLISRLGIGQQRLQPMPACCIKFTPIVIFRHTEVFKLFPCVSLT